MAVRIFGIVIPAIDFEDLKKWVSTKLSEDNKLSVSKAPAEFLLRAQKNPEFKEVLQKSDLVIADGVGVLWTAKYLSLPLTKIPIIKQIQAIWQMIYSGVALIIFPNYAKSVLPERLSGVEVLYTMLEACAEAGKSVFFFGARPEVLETSVEIIREKFPTLKIAGYYNGYGDKGKKLIEQINKSGASLLIVALGSPEQEFWIRDNLKYLNNVRVAVGEGGSFDYIAGSNKRAPKIIQKIGMEWLWRGFTAKNLTAGSSSRLKRVWNAVPVFIYEVVKYKLSQVR